MCGLRVLQKPPDNRAAITFIKFTASYLRADSGSTSSAYGVWSRNQCEKRNFTSPAPYQRKPSKDRKTLWESVSLPNSE